MAKPAGAGEQRPTTVFGMRVGVFGVTGQAGADTGSETIGTKRVRVLRKCNGEGSGGQASAMVRRGPQELLSGYLTPDGGQS